MAIWTGANVGSGGSGYSIGGGGGSTSGSHDDGFRRVNGFTTELHDGAQGKHIPGHNNYDPSAGRSIFGGSLADAQRLISEFAGSGTWQGTNKETVDFGENIGTWISPDGTQRFPTTRGTIHYGRHGAHIVPAHPGGN